MGIRRTYGSGNKENRDPLEVTVETNGEPASTRIIDLCKSGKLHNGNKPFLQKRPVNLYPRNKTRTKKLS